MTSQVKINYLLLDKAETLLYSLGFTGLIDMPDRAFTVPDAPTEYCEVRIFPNTPDGPLWGAEEIHFGILQIALISYEQKGSIKPMKTCDAIRAGFVKGTVLEADGTRVRIHRPPGALALIQDGHKSTYPVSIPYRATGS